MKFNDEKIYICTAKTLTGLEEVLSNELIAMDYKNVKILKRAVQFDADLKGIYLANLNLRTALSVLVAISSFKFRDKDDLYRKAFDIDWENIFDVKKTMAVKSTLFGNMFNNSLYTSLLVKDAIADRFRRSFKVRPNVDRERPDVLIDVYINENFCTISLNSSGRPLYLRGYRHITFEAPLNECLAAGMIGLTGWSADTNLLNPMCGSGTIIIEALMMALKVHPAKLRDDFAFTAWKNFDSDLFQKGRQELINAELKELKIELQASDLSNRSLSIARNSLINLGLENFVTIVKMNFLKPKVTTKTGLIILNPPYDERLKEENIDEMYEGIGSSLKNDYTGHSAFILSSNIEALKHIGLKTSKKFDLLNGKIPCKFQGYELYEGSKKGI